ncbi:hypothetical protein KS4_08080 [Poriferisphaera corsica]|uniref:ClbS/DfsB family four-helix bundle protein n=1 Tax=Poriferisphaera corsica TaxID=2528020 RepID=A0A517YRD6_9BACT|nr:ClbS/DfsB family four-helix bundle protein [Poriferisphaera corsica]QDU32774.1 hypothetical protein KS4_08080 [Poriferisphaera corsica]
MPLAETKVELLAQLEKAYRLLDDEFEGMLEGDANKKGVASSKSKDGEMVSCCEVVAYQIGWGGLLLGWEAAERDGQKAVMPCAGYKWNELGRLADRFYRENKGKSLKRLRSEWADIYAKIRRMIESLDEIELLEVGQRKWTGEKWSMVKWIQVNTIGPYGSARTRVRKFKKSLQK